MMDEAVIGKLLELGIISGGFVYLLYFVTNKLSKTLEDVIVAMKEVGETNAGILKVLNTLNARVSRLEGEGRRVEQYPNDGPIIQQADETL